MNYFLAKTEPLVYSIDQLRTDRRTIWDGVRNSQALRAIRLMHPGDRVFIYHSGEERAVVGLAEVLSESRADPKDSKLAVVDLGYVTHLEPAATLNEVKNSRLFDNWSLVTQSRLSTMAAPNEFVEWMRGRYPQARI